MRPVLWLAAPVVALLALAACGGGGSDPAPPSCAPHQAVGAEDATMCDACTDALDNDADTFADCLDLGCDGLAGCEHGNETTCDDAFDNDGDGDADCLDSDCDLLAGCEFPGEHACNDAFDNDGDGLTDCQEPDCALPCAIAPCAGGQLALGYSATGLPKTIADLSTNHTTIPVMRPGTVQRVAVEFSATHSFDADLVVSIAHAGTARTLALNRGGSSNNYTNTIFIDSAVVGIGSTTALPPFSGQFRPEQALSLFNGTSANGDWTMTVRDVYGADVGSWTEYRLGLCASP